MAVPSAVRQVGAYALGIWAAFTAWAALAQYVLPGRGQALGKLGSFQWVFLINLLPALLCAVGFAAGLAARRTRTPSGATGWRVALLLGMAFPLTVPLLMPVLTHLGRGLGPALVWCVIGSAAVGALIRGRERRDVVPSPE